MPIQLPQSPDEVKPIGVGAPPSVGRIENQVPDLTSGFSSQMAGLDKVGQQVIKYRDAVADQTADIAGTDAANKLQQIFKRKMYGDPETGEVGLLYKEGNPTDMYKNLDKEMQDQIDTLSKPGDSQSWGDETQTVVNRRLNKMAESLQLEQLTNYGNQQKKYDDGVSDTAVSLAQQSMPVASSHVDPTQSDSYGPLQMQMNRIRDARIAQAVRYGGADESENGLSSYTAPDGTLKKVDLTPTTQAQISADISKGLYGTIDNLYKTGGADSIAKAEAIKEKFSDMLDPLHKDKLSSTADNAVIENRSYQLSADLKGKTPDQIQQALQNENPKVQHKTLQLIKDNASYIENLRKMQQEDNYRALYSQVEKYKQSNPAATSSDIEAQPWFKSLAPHVTPQNLKAVNSFVAPPAKTDAKSQAAALKILQGDDERYPDLSKITPDQLAQVTSGLGNDATGSFLRRRIMEAAVPSNSQKNQQYRAGVTALKNQAFNLGLISPNNDAGNDVQKGSAMAQKLNDLTLEYSKHLSNQGEMTPSQVNEDANKFVKDHLATKSTGGGFFGLFGGSSEAKPAASTGPTDAQIRGRAISLYKQETGGQPNQKQLDDYVQSNKPAILKSLGNAK